MNKKCFYAIITCLSLLGNSVISQAREMTNCTKTTRATNIVPLPPEFHVDAIHGDEYLCSIILNNVNQDAVSGWSAEFDCIDLQEEILLVCPAQYTKTDCHVKMTNLDLISSKAIDANKTLNITLIIKDPNHHNSPIVNLTAVGFVNASTDEVPAIPVLNPITTSNGNYTVSWNSVSTANRYILQQSTTNDFSTPVTVFDGFATAKTFANQSSGTCYYRVAAANDIGMSAFSNIQSITFSDTPPPTPLAAPTASSTTNSSGVSTLSWTSVNQATQYLVQESSDNFATVKEIFRGSATSLSLAGHALGIFGFRVKATNSSTESPWSNTITIEFKQTPPPPPPPLVAPTASSTTDTSGVSTLSWTSVNQATQYVVQESSDNFATVKEIFRGSATSLSLAGHALGIFAFRVKATNSSTESPWSNTITIEFKQAPPPPPPSGNKIVAYYTSWSIYRNPVFRPLNINGDLVTHINYAFINNDKAGNLILGDPNADTGYKYTSSANLPYWGNFRQLYELKQKYPNVKILFSVGGWSDSNNFPAMAASATARKNFAQQCVAFADKYHFDGVDIDWEYPGYSSHNGTSADKQNFTLLLQELNTAAKAHNPALLVTIAAPADEYFYKNIELNKIPQYLDWINIMCYDFAGADWSDVTNHQSNLYPTQTNQVASCDGSVKAYIANGVPANKITLGIPFYGRTFANANSTPTGLFSTFSGPGTDDGSDDAGVRSFADIIKNQLNNYTQHFDDIAKAPYLHHPTTKEFITFDNVQSIGLKCQYIKSTNLAGASMWEIGHDTVPDFIGMSAIKQGLS